MVHPRIETGQPVRIYGALLALVCLAYGVTLQVIDNGRILWAFSDFVLVSAALVFAAAAIRRSRHCQGSVRRGWRLLASSGLCFALGQSSWAALQLLGDDAVPFPSYPEFFYLAALPLAGAGVMCFLGAPLGAAARARTVVDGLLLAFSLSFVWSTVLGRSFRAAATATMAAQAVGLAFPALHVVVVSLVVIVVARNGGRLQIDLISVGAGLVISAASYGGFAWLIATDSYHTGHLLDVGWVGSFGVMTVGALWHARADPPRPSQVGGALAIAAPYIIAGVAFLIALVDLVATRDLDLLQICIGVGVVLLLLTRQLMSLFENHALTRDLERKVLLRTADLAASQSRYQSVIDSVHDVLFQADLAGTSTFLSHAWVDITGHTIEESIGQPMFTFIHPDDQQQMASTLRSLLADDEEVRTKLRVIARDGSVKWLEAVAYVLRADTGEAIAVAGTLTDVTDRRVAEHAVRRVEERWRLLLESSGEGIYGVDVEGRCTFINAAAAAMLGSSPEAVLGNNMHRLMHHTRPDGSPSPAAECPIRHSFTESLACRVDEDLFWRPDGTSFPTEYSSQPITRDGVVEGAVVTFNDITVRLAEQREVRHRALHDGLTGLPNRALILDRLEQAIRGAERSSRLAALLIMDLDRFKDINDTFGHPVGDRVLEHVAARMTGQGLLRSEDTVGRLGGDEFAVVLPSLATLEEALAIAAKIRAAVSQPVRIDNNVFQVGCSIGVAIAPLHGTHPTTLVQRADVAMYLAKGAGVGIAHYTSADDAARVARLELIEELRLAISADGLQVHYQPIVDLRTGRILYLEALCRWPENERGAVPADVFVPLSEQAGLIMPLTSLVVRHALGQSRLWRARGIDVPVAINVSAQTLHDPQLMALVESWQSGRSSQGPLHLEITESAVISEPSSAVRVLERLVSLGVSIAIDDFGTGYSSLAQLKRLPVQAVKIDRSFVSEMGTDRRDASIVRSIIQLGHTLDLKIIAEGVESEASARHLLRLGCDYAQGWHYGRPLPAAGITPMLANEPGAVAGPVRHN